ncbi:MAG: carboxypeptidase-like regulatory domain-containing protein [Planctomycetota bacterium]
MDAPVVLRRSRLSACSVLLLVLLLHIAASGAQVREPVLPLFQQQEGFPSPFVLQRLHDKPLLVSGCVLDPTENPIAGAHVAVMADLPNSFLPVFPPQVLGEATTGADGRFQATMPGVLLHQVASLWVVARHEGRAFGLQTLDVAAQRHSLTLRLRQEQPVHGQVLDPDMASLEVTIPMRRGVTIRGRVVGPGDETIEKAVLLTHTSTRYYFWPTPPIDLWARPVRDSRFELPGCDPESPHRVYFLDAGHQWGATATLDGSKPADEPVTIRLAPCGSATARFMDKDNHPLANRVLGSSAPYLITVVRLVFLEASVNERYGTADDLVWWMEPLDRDRYRSLRTDAEGRVTFPSLVPGALYKLMIISDKGWEPQRSFRVEAGQSLDLGDIVVNVRE